VREHFSLLRDIIAETGGAVVKTMGDAVMASFAEPSPALEAAILMSREIGKIGGDESLALKIGLHTGPVVAIESNERLDYFGQTVNIASRVQEIARAGEIVITDPVYQGNRSQAAIRSAQLQIQPDRAALRGIGGEVGFYRLN
jgi:class 3 adenylate cyclase